MTKPITIRNMIRAELDPGNECPTQLGAIQMRSRPLKNGIANMPAKDTLLCHSRRKKI